jgi:hypothetical protein
MGQYEQAAEVFKDIQEMSGIPQHAAMARIAGLSAVSAARMERVGMKMVRRWERET